MSDISPSIKTKGLMVAAIVAIVVALMLVVKYANNQAESGELTYTNPVLVAEQVDVGVVASENPEGDAVVEPEYAIVQTDYRDTMVTIDEYSDFECPACQNMAPVLKGLLERYHGQVQLRYHDNPLTSIHAFAFEAAIVGECASRQNLFVPVHDAMFENQQDWSSRTYSQGETPTDTVFLGYAEAVGANMDEMRSCVASEDAESAVEEDMRDASRQNINSTPTVFVDGERFVGQRYEELEELVRQAVEAKVGPEDMGQVDFEGVSAENQATTDAPTEE